MSEREAQPVNHRVLEGHTLHIAQGGEIVVAPASGHIHGDVSKKATLYLALPEGEQSVTLTMEDVCRLVALLRKHGYRVKEGISQGLKGLAWVEQGCQS